MMLRNSLRFALAGLLVSLASPTHSATFPSHLNLVGLNAAHDPDALAGQFVVHFATMPSPPTVMIDFSSAHGLVLASPQPDPMLIVSCLGSAQSVTAPVVASGSEFIATFVIAGGATGTSVPPVPGPIYVSVNANLTGLGLVPVSAYDLDGSGGVGLSDLSIWTTDYFAGTNSGRSDFNGNGTVEIADLGLWAGVYFSAHETLSGGPSYCVIP